MHHLVRRLGSALLVLLAVSFVIFIALATVPGDAATALAGESASQAQLDTLRRQLGLDAPLLVRYGRFLAGLLHGDLGSSLISGRPVGELLAERFPYTLTLAVASVGLATALGMAFGVAAATRAGTALDTLIMAGVTLGMALPSFWVGLLLIMVFALELHWLPVVGAGTPQHLILPAITLALPTAAVVARLMRSSLLDVWHAEFVRTAHAKGLPRRQVLQSHMLRNSLIPLTAVIGLHLGHLLGGAFVVETIFGWPGLGRLTVQAIFDRDLPVVLGAALTLAGMFVLTNLAVDLLHAWLDPRIRTMELA